MEPIEIRSASGSKQAIHFGGKGRPLFGFYHPPKPGSWRAVDALVLWSPWVSGAKFVDEVTKLHKLYLSVEPQMTAAFPSRADGEEALGLFLPRALIEDLSRIDLLRTARRPARRTLFIDGGNVAGRDALMSHLGELGAEPELRSHTGHKFLITISHGALLPDEVIDSIVGWLTDVYPATSESPRPEPRASGPPPAGERSIRIGAEPPLFGILTPAHPRRAGPGRPPLLITQPGPGEPPRAPPPPLTTG